jgi:hypothetical protein
MRWHRRRNIPKRIVIRETEQFTRKLLHARQSHFIPSASWKAENIHIYLTIDPMGTIETIFMSIIICFAPESFLPIPFQLSFAYILTFYILLAEYLTQLQTAIMSLLIKAISALLLTATATATAIAFPEPQASVTNVASFQSLLKTECSQLVFIYDDIITGYTVIENDLPSVRLPPILMFPNIQIGTVTDGRVICSRFPSHSCPFSKSRWPML